MMLPRWALLVAATLSAAQGVAALMAAWYRWLDGAPTWALFFLLGGLFLTYCAADALWAVFWAPAAADRPGGEDGRSGPSTGQE